MYIANIGVMRKIMTRMDGNMLIQVNGSVMYNVIILDQGKYAHLTSFTYCQYAFFCSAPIFYFFFVFTKPMAIIVFYHVRCWTP